ncbi:unnamed protein product [Somion occarium]|uniref:Dolichol phosphate-mannose biosynthesis regulatory protein n=1 Tax=Somion occarium TaxID=3059160 RepID=A0ABP1D997_9APHY
MVMSDKALGGLMLSFSGAILVYYSLWTILLPFFDSSSPVHDYFPKREWAVRLSAFIIILGVSAIGMLLSVKILKHHTSANNPKKSL